jgi:hypothetical protein
LCLLLIRDLIVFMCFSKILKYYFKFCNSTLFSALTLGVHLHWYFYICIPCLLTCFLILCIYLLRWSLAVLSRLVPNFWSQVFTHIQTSEKLKLKVCATMSVMLTFYLASFFTFLIISSWIIFSSVTYSLVESILLLITYQWFVFGIVAIN